MKMPKATIKRKNKKENTKQIPHEYKVKDRILIVKESYKRTTSAKFSAPTEVEGSYEFNT